MSDSKPEEVDFTVEGVSDSTQSSSIIDANLQLPKTNNGNEKFLIYDRVSKNQIFVEKDWTPEEEKRARLKIDFIIMPLLAIAFFILQMDRGNISNALTDTLRADIKIDTDDVNVGTALFNVGIVIFEIPSNLILQKVGPGRWLSFQIIIWSVIATAQSQIKTRSHFLATRFLLGAFEAGFIPGALLYISTWYKKSELTLRHNIYFFGNLLASACSGLIAAGILKNLPGVGGYAGWQWIFITEGVTGVGFGVIFTLLIPESSKSPRPFWAPAKFNYLSERQQYILTQRIVLDDPEKLISTSRIRWSTLRNVFSQWHIWGHFIFTLSVMINSQAMSTYTPLIIRTMGYSKVGANARSSIPAWMALIFLGIATFTSKRFKPRGATPAFIALWHLIFLIVLRALPDGERAVVKFAILVVLLTPGATAHVLNTSWLSMNCRTPQERSIAMAIVVMAANIAGICGGQVLREHDRPYYHKGFLAIIFTNAFAAFWCVCLIVSYYIINRKIDASQNGDTEAPVQEKDTILHSPNSTLVVLVGEGSAEDDALFLEKVEGEYHVQDKNLETIQGLLSFRFTP